MNSWLDWDTWEANLQMNSWLDWDTWEANLQMNSWLDWTCIKSHAVFEPQFKMPAINKTLKIQSCLYDKNIKYFIPFKQGTQF